MSYQPPFTDPDATSRRDARTRYSAIASHIRRHRVLTPSGGRPDRSALDVGAYRGYFAGRLSLDFPEADITAVDDHLALTKELSQARVTVVPERWSTEQVRAELETKGDRWDAVLLLSVLHHGSDWRHFLEAARDAARWLYVEVPHPDEHLPRAVVQDVEEREALLQAAADGAELLCSVPGYDPRFPRHTFAVRADA